jgi:hypothetical protein
MHLGLKEIEEEKMEIIRGKRGKGGEKQTKSRNRSEIGGKRKVDAGFKKVRKSV